jgi:Tfp pilus assembly protein PilF
VIDAAKLMAYFDDAIQCDPHDAVTRRGWLLSLVTFAYLVPSALPDILERLRTHAESGPASSPPSIEARIAGGVAAMFNRENRLAADILYQAAEMAPTNADARTALGTFLLHIGDWEGALRETRAGERLDPLSASNTGMVALSLMGLGRFADARLQAKRSLSLDPSFALSRMLLADIELFAGNTAEALRAMTQICESCRQHPLARGKLAYAYGVTGDSARARNVLQELLAAAPNSTHAAPSIALSYLGLGERKNALKWLGIANEQNSLADILQGRLPFFESLRSEPGFDALMPSYG